MIKRAATAAGAAVLAAALAVPAGTGLAHDDAEHGVSGTRSAQWWPSEWGPDDQKGALNRLTPEKVVAAAALIKTGKVYDLGRVFEEAMPLFALTPVPRKYTVVSPGGPSWGPLGDNRLSWNDDWIAGNLGQDGTQFDALAHMGTWRGAPGDVRELRYYNGHSHAEIAGPYGFSKLGIEQVSPIFTRGVLLDFAGLKGRMLAKSEEIGVEDIKAALKRQGLTEDDIGEGDALFYNTGWGRLWKVDNTKFNSGTPGLSDRAGDWVVAKKVVLVGTDNWAVEAIPNPKDAKLFAPNHQKFLIVNGIYIMENMNFDPLIADKAWVFAFSVGTIPFKGATGSPVRPFALR